MSNFKLLFNKFTRCLNFRHIVLIFTFTTSTALSAADQNKVILYQEQNYNLSQSGNSTNSTRVPASTGYRENMMERPPTPVVPIINRIFMGDHSEVLRDASENSTKWRNTEETAENWNLESTGLYETPSDEEKGLYYKKRFLKFMEKRFFGEVRKRGKTVFTSTKPSKKDPKDKDSKAGETKSAEDPTALVSEDARKNIDTVKNFLNPTASKEIAKDTKLRVRVRPLQGRIFLVLQNPYADTELRLSAKKEVVVNMNRSFDKLGLETSLNYQAKQKYWETHVNKTLTKTVSANFSSAQRSSQMAFSGPAIKVVQLVYNLPF